MRVADGTSSIGSRAFANSGNLEWICLPSSVTDIAPDAFEGDAGLTIYGDAGSAAEAFALQRASPFSRRTDVVNPKATRKNRPVRPDGAVCVRG